MKAIFPGMDPYLEAPGIWPDFHDSFLAYARESLQPVLPDKYYVQLRTREEIGIAGIQADRVIYPDLGIKEKAEGGGRPSSKTEPAGSLNRPEVLVIPTEDPLKVSYIEIREVNGDLLVTLIELLSPSNKLPGEDRERFESKRREVLQSSTNWIEIDLLRSGKRIDPRIDQHCNSRSYQYVVVVSRGSKRQPLNLEVYGFTVRDPLPVMAVPLRDSDPDVPLDLGHVFGRAYESGPYGKIIRYHLPPEPKLPPGDAAWARGLTERRTD